MTAKENLMAFLAGDAGAATPFMPIFMRYCARHTGTLFRDFILDVEAHCQSNMRTARDFSSCWVNVMSDPYCELSAYGAEIHYPADSMPMEEIVLMDSVEKLRGLGRIDFAANPRAVGRLEQLRCYRRTCRDEWLITGWVEGPLAEYCDLRSMGNAFLDIYDEPALMRQAIEVILENAREFIRLQVEAGAECIGIGDAACSQVSPEIYREFAFAGEKMLVDFIHAQGALAKLHICGNTTAILPDMIRTGADIVDVDHLVKDMTPFYPLLGPGQVLCGNLDPVAVIQDGTPAQIRAATASLVAASGRRLIVSAGCEITPDTPAEHILAMIPSA